MCIPDREQSTISIFLFFGPANCTVFIFLFLCFLIFFTLLDIQDLQLIKYHQISSCFRKQFCYKNEIMIVAFHRVHRAGPRKEIYYEPEEVKAAIVTCGGLSPGLNDVIRQV